jgi:hypothetical protein
MESNRGRNATAEDGVQHRIDKIEKKGGKIKLLEEQRKKEQDRRILADINTKINQLQRDTDILNTEIGQVRLFQGLQGKRAEDAISDVITELEDTTIRVKRLITDISKQATDIEGMKTLLEDNEKKVGVILKNLSDYVETTYPNGEALNIGLHSGGLFLALAGLAFGIACLVIAVNGEDDDKKEADNLDQLSSDSLALGENTRDPKEMSEDQLEEMMQNFVVDRGVIASGKVLQTRLWQNLAGVADKTEIGDQDLALVLLQEATSGLPGTREFLWLDASQASDRYDALRAAYKKSRKLSDVYLAATKTEYDGEEVPTFHMALLLQCALKTIHHDSLFPDTPTPAVA